MHIAALRVPVTFQKNETVIDAYGNHTNKWTDYFKCYATIGMQTGNESTGEVINPEESLDITCRYCSELECVTSTKYRMLIFDHVYDITYVNPLGFKKNAIKFNGKLVKK